MYDVTYMWTQENDISEHIYKTEVDSETQKTNSWLPKRKEGREKLMLPKTKELLHCYAHDLQAYLDKLFFQG